MTITAVGFDLDETLAVPTRDRTAILSDATERADAPSLTREAYLDVHGRHLTSESRTPIFAELLSGHETDTDPETLAETYRREIADALVPIPGAEAFLQRLRSEYRVGLLTNGPRVAQRDKLATLGWTDAFDAALVTGDLDAGKPDSAAFAALLDALGSDAGATAYVGDDVDADIAGADAAGLVPIQVLYEGGPEPSSRAAAHVRREDLVDRLPELLDAF
ncbi:HAD family hydrolase [Halobellus limi]|uniref:HAD family hydrolase n=1 Tax=Halobellus limi TaxID=699433 RepID=A0A1H5TDY8_9EURY|nr:HAD family hydrolase [Halobellus limi]QCC47335.1 HAD family hydrolase [Halobellus limi]SEF60983.1 putative hydrolase of the HAD superfamily [Halobellus limi]